MTLTDAQARAMRWINEYPSTRAAWTVDGKPIRKQKPEKWNVMEIGGAAGSILIAAEDLKAITPFVEHCTAPDKMYSLNAADRAALAEQKDRNNG